MKSIALSIAVIISCLVRLPGQSLSETFLFANEQLAQGWTKSAEKAFKRVLFFDTDNKYRGRCMEVLANLALEQGKYQDALNYLDQAYFLATDAAEANDFQTKRIQIYIETNQIQKALSEIYQTDETFDTMRIKLYEGYCQYWLRDFDAMALAMHGILDPVLIQDFKAKGERIERMNPRFYQTMSYIFPGLGQLLLGEVKQSANSLVLSAALATLFIETARRLTLFDAIISVVPWFYRYYSGGAKLTLQLAEEKKKRRHEKNLKNMLSAIKD